VKLEQNSSCAVALSCVTLVLAVLFAVLRSGFRDTALRYMTYKYPVS